MYWLLIALLKWGKHSQYLLKVQNMDKIPKTLLVLALAIASELSFSQNASIIIDNNTFLVPENGAYIVLPGNLQSDGKVVTDAQSYWNFSGNIQQKITCKNASGCTEIFNVNSYNTVLGNVNQNNSDGIAVEINTKVLGTHSFNIGSTEIRDGSYWLANSVLPYSNNDNTNKFFVTTGKGLLKQSNVNTTGTLFPVGSAGNKNNYTPITVSTTSTDNFAVRVYNNVYYAYNVLNGDYTGYLNPEAVNYRFVKKTWIVNKETTVTSNFLTTGFTATLQWNLVNEDAAFTAIKFQKSSVVRNHDTLWFPQESEQPVTQISPTAFTKTDFIPYDNAFYPYYPLSVSAINEVLAVTGLALEGKLTDGNADLNWATLTEVNADHFEVERSDDGRTFEKIGDVAAFGNSSIRRNYSYDDKKVAAPIIYYRIKEVDKDGNFSFSNTIILQSAEAFKGLKIYPNPVSDHFNIEFNHLAGAYTMQLISADGKTLLEKEASVDDGIEKILINNIDGASGIYMLRIINRTTYQTKNIKLLIAK